MFRLTSRCKTQLFQLNNTRKFFESAFIGKGKDSDTKYTFNTSKFTIREDGLIALPNNEMQTKIGDDSFFMTPNFYLGSNKKDEYIRYFHGVSDGVGGWVTVKDGAPHLVSQNLMAHCERSAVLYASRVMASSTAILTHGYEKLLQAPPGMGSTTAIIVNLTKYHKDTWVEYTSVGDSGVAILRLNEQTKVYEYISEPIFQTVGHNTPFQLACGVPAHDLPFYNLPGEGIRISAKLLPGDLIIAGTDGVWDNIFLQEITDIINRLPHQNDPEFCTNLASEIMKFIESVWRKYDDVSCIVTRVVE